MKTYEVMPLNRVTTHKWILNINKSIHTVKYELEWSEATGDSLKRWTCGKKSLKELEA